jgi:hypothetical protein
VRARAPFQESKTASTARSSCSRGFLWQVLTAVLDQELPELERQPPEGDRVQLAVVPGPGLAARGREPILEHGVVHAEDGVCPYMWTSRR